MSTTSLRTTTKKSTIAFSFGKSNKKSTSTSTRTTESTTTTTRQTFLPELTQVPLTTTKQPPSGIESFLFENPIVKEGEKVMRGIFNFFGG